MSNMDLATLGSLPIPGENPAGSDAKYEPEYEAVLAEIEKLSSATQGGVVAWSVVAEQGQIVLSCKSKDLCIATYLGVAWQELCGIEGLCNALQLFTDLCTHFWTQAFPPLSRLRRRTNAFDWWHEHAFALLQTTASQNQPLSGELVSTLTERLETLDRLIEELMPEAQPLRDMREMVRRIPTPPAAQPEAPEAEEPEPVPGTAPTPAPQAASPDPSPAPPVLAQQNAPPTPDTAHPADADQLLIASRKQFIDTASKYALLAHRANAQDPEPWYLLRMALWTKVAALPPAEKGQTMLPPPDMMQLAALRSLAASGKFLDAALAGEDFFPTALFCFDVHQLIDTALEALGTDFLPARTALQTACMHFVQRLPGVEKLAFADGTAFASPTTQEWLQTLDAQTQRRTPAPPALAQAAASSDERCALPLAQAEELLAQKQVDLALQTLEKAQGPSLTANLSLKVAQVRLLCQAGEQSVAAALAQGMVETVAQRNLETWEPQYAVQVFLAARDAYHLAQEQEKALTMQGKIAQLQPSAALGWHK